MKRWIVSCFCAHLLAALSVSAAQGQELVRPSKGAKYLSLGISPDNKWLLATSQRKMNGDFAEDAGLHLFDLGKHERHVLFRNSEIANEGAVPQHVA